MHAAQEVTDPDLQRALLASAVVHYQSALTAWDAVILDDPHAPDLYEKKFWAADARMKIVRLERALGKPVPLEELQFARRALQAVIDHEGDDKFQDIARSMLAALDK